MSRNTLSFKLQPADNARLAKLCGSLDSNLKLLAETLAVTIRRRGETFTVSGEGAAPEQVHSALAAMYATGDGAGDQAAAMRLAASSAAPPAGSMAQAAGVAARTANQDAVMRSLSTLPVTFGEGPAGTGKTFLAVACAVEALNQRAVDRIVLVRPAVEAGESLGYLPGNMIQKVHPYLLPLVDALREICGGTKTARLIERGIIELAPLAYMRGRTLKSSFVILDEAQNTTVAQMKMLLTRLGIGSSCGITGDCSQIDLPAGEASGLADILRRVGAIASCGIVRFAKSDVARHPVVDSILQAYDEQ